MIRRAPAENYFKYLVVHPACYENKYIEDVARELGLDFLGPWYVQWLRERMRPPRPFYPEDERHTKSQRFLIVEQLEEAFHPSQSMNTAHQILCRPRWREVVETLLLTKAPYPIIVQALKKRHKANANEKAIRLYKHFFWNVDLLDSVEMRALLDMRHHGVLESDTANVQVQYGSIRRMRHTDPRVVAARLPASPLSAVLSQMELGALPKKVDLSQVLHRTLEVAALRAFEAVSAGGPNGVHMGQGFMLIADIANRLKSSVVNPEDRLREDLQKISIATTPRQVPSVQQLTAGNHTTNVHPEPKAEEVIEGEFEEEDEDDNA
jgi:hypothetical protein